MDSRFDNIATHPENAIHQVVFYPDRIYHARYLNATTSTRYRYYVHEVRAKSDIILMKGAVFLDGGELANIMRIEYRANRLLESVRENNRQLGRRVLATFQLEDGDGTMTGEQSVWLNYCPWIDALQVELWSTTAPPDRTVHDFRVLSSMGAGGSIVASPFSMDLPSVRRVHIKFMEDERVDLLGWKITDRAADDFYGPRGNTQVPISPEPDATVNNVETDLFILDFRRGWFLDSTTTDPVRYMDPMMNKEKKDKDPNNVVEMRWLLQQEFGGTVRFFHEVTVPPGVVEGTHRHVGSEELYYIVSGEGTAYLGEFDDPTLNQVPVVERDIFGIGPRRCREVSVRRGHVIFTKSGGIHGIENPHPTEPLVFVAFLYHSA
jgi:mannose-6-phosphate isomerase-like protein (cupin superfamily)